MGGKRENLCSYGENNSETDQNSGTSNLNSSLTGKIPDLFYLPGGGGGGGECGQIIHHWTNHTLKKIREAFKKNLLTLGHCPKVGGGV